jgi:hypothetical protein
MERKDPQAVSRFIIGFVVGIAIGAGLTWITNWLMGRETWHGLTGNLLAFGLIFGIVMQQGPHLFGQD